MDQVAEALVAGQTSSKPVATRVSAADGPLHALLSEAVRRRASHVHVEPNAQGAGITLRIGGQIADGGELSPEALAGLVAELCVAADLEPHGERARHGSLEWAGSGVAVAVLPVADGVSLVFRLDPGDRRDKRLEALGMRQGLVSALRPALAKGGLVLVAGPQGSGRSTTLRALLDHADGKARRLMVAEQEASPPIPARSGPWRATDAP
jgi:general secretion pathway protein E